MSFATRLQTSSRIPSTGAAPGGRAHAAADSREASEFGPPGSEPPVPGSVRLDGDPQKPLSLVAEMLGLDPLNVANEGKVVAVTRPEDAPRALEALRAHPLGRGAAEIGEVKETRDGICEIRTAAGGTRLVQKPYGEELPRIC